MKEFDRRAFLKFLGVTTYSLSSASMLVSMTGCNSEKDFQIPSIAPSFKDDLLLAKGLSYQKIISFGDQMTPTEIFGFNNDYIDIEPISSTELLMWVNHEYINPQFVGGWERTKENIDKERAIIGGSIIKLKQKDGKWNYVKDDKNNRAIRATTKIPFNNGEVIRGKDYAIGTLANCAGGKTPWGTFLTCEENFQHFYGTRDLKTDKIIPSSLAWESVYDNPPEHYGWVVEINPHTGAAKKHTNLGRFSHESAKCVLAKKGNVVVYSGDDKADEFIYKFISDTKDSFDSGTLYVADITNGKWLPLDLEKSPILKKHFKTKLDVMIFARKAARLLGATELDRPEDIEVHPVTGDIYVTLTNNKKKQNYHGSILKINEANGDYNSLNFKSETFAFGGKTGGFSCPDNLAFDKNGNLWVCSDISGRKIGKEPYTAFGNNGLFIIPTSGPQAGVPIQVGSGPVDCELTGLCFSPDFKTLFLSVQHPGENSKDMDNLTSNWPSGGIPKSSVIALSGDLLDKLAQ